MNHSFNINIAKKIGINGAIILENLYFWCKKNKANNKNFFENNFWTYNSIKAWKELLPYFSEKQIRTTLDKLEKMNLIKTGNYSKLKYNRTKWYSLTADALMLFGDDKKEFSICTKGINESVQKGETNITVINTVINKDTLKESYKEKKGNEKKEEEGILNSEIHLTNQKEEKRKKERIAPRKKKKVVPNKEELMTLFEEVAEKYNWFFDYELEADKFLDWFADPKCKRKDWKRTATNWARSMKSKNAYWRMNMNNQPADKEEYDPNYSPEALKRLFGDDYEE